MTRNRIQPNCRPARREDTPQVEELTRLIWEGEDYVPKVWPEWLADPAGQLAVAEYAGRVIGLGKLTQLSPEEWWLEGLRVHPDYEGRGVASSLQEHLLSVWEETGGGTVRLATASSNRPVHHLCQRTGFVQVGEFTPFVAPALHDGRQPVFRVVSENEVGRALQAALQSESLRLAFGLMDLGWQWALPAAQHLLDAVQRGQALWWENRQGLLVFREDEEEQQTRPSLQLLACAGARMIPCLVDFRRLAGSLGFSEAEWMAPLRPEMPPLLEAAGFVRNWDESIRVFAKPS